MRTHFVIPDTQVKPGVPTDHFRWIGQYIVDKKPDVIIDLGDHYDLPSLSSYDRGKLQFEGRRFRADVEAGNNALDILMAPMRAYNRNQIKNRKTQYKPQMEITFGNHEYRAERAAEERPELEGMVGFFLFEDYFQANGWNTHRYGEVVDIDGIWYTHAMFHELTGRPMGAMASTMLKQIGHTFTMGHRQVYDLATRYVGEKMQRATIAGACYLHDEEYKGPNRKDSARSANHHWRGCLMKHDVVDGEYSLMELPLDFFCRRYEGVSLKEFQNG